MTDEEPMSPPPKRVRGAIRSDEEGGSDPDATFAPQRLRALLGDETADSSAAWPGSEAAAPKQLGDYRIIREIGRGGMGIVYEAEQVSLGRHVALKVLPQELLKNPKQRLRFEREAKAAAQLHHTNIVPVFGVGEDAGQDYYVMQFIQGLPLDKVLEERRWSKQASGSSPGTAHDDKLLASREDTTADRAKSLMTGGSSPTRAESGRARTGSLSDTLGPSDSSALSPADASIHRSAKQPTYWERVAMIGVQVADALEYAHGQGILHRDIKPANLLLDERGTVWVTDFGLAKLEDERNLTQTGDILGTLRYMAPESFKGQADARSEVYSLGLTLYELLALRPAFDQQDKTRLIDQVMHAKAKPLGEVNPQVPVDLRTIVHKAIDFEPQHRYASAGELAADLQRFVDDQPIQARRISVFERFRRWSRRNKQLAASLTFAALLLAVIAVGSTIAAGYFRSLSKDLTASEQRATETASHAKTERDAAEHQGYAATIQLAEAMLRGDAPTRYRVADLLWSTQPKLRGWEWGYLMAHCPLEQWSLATPDGGLATLATSADGRYLATATGDGKVILWDLSNRTEIWRRETGLAGTLAIDSRSRFVAVAFADKSKSCFTILDIGTGRTIHQAAEDGRAHIAFSPDGENFYAAVRSTDNPAIRRYDTKDWRPQAETPWPDESLRGDNDLFVDADDRYVGLFKCYEDTPREGDLKFTFFDADSLDVASARESWNEPAINTQSPTLPALKSTRGDLVYTHVDTVLRRSSAADPTTVAMLPDRIEHLFVDWETGDIVAATRDGLVRRVRADGDERDIWHGTPISGMAVLPDGRLLTGGTDGLIKCWDLNDSVELLADQAPAGIPSAAGVMVDFSSDGQHLVFADYHIYLGDPQRRQFFLLDTASSNVDIHVHTQPMRAIKPRFRPGTDELLICERTGLSFYQRRENHFDRLIRTIEVPKPRFVAMGRAGRVLTVTTDDERTRVFDLGTGREFPAPAIRGLGPGSVGPDGKWAALLTPKELTVWEVATGRILNRWNVPRSIANGQGLHIEMTPHPTEDLVVLIADRYRTDSAAGMNPVVYLWDTQLGEMRAVLSLRTGIIPYECQFSRDGDRLVIGNYHGSVDIWDWRGEQFLLTLPASRGRASSVAQSPNGLTLAYTGWAPSLQVCRALPWTSARNREFYQAVDDLRAVSERIARQETASNAGNTSSE